MSVKQIRMRANDGGAWSIRAPDEAARPSGATASASPGGESVALPIAMLSPGESPRLEGHDAAHVARLAEIEGPLPPILVDRRTLRVIDGMHRLLAALMRGEQTIEARFFDGTPADAFLAAVHANVAHGFPLSQADRRAAAARIIASHAHMSDRAIAEVAGLGAKTVAGIRRTSAQGQSPVRIGRDGRARPVDAVAGRRRVAALISQHPWASARELARYAGVSPATASDVRKRLERGEEPAPGGDERGEREEVRAPSAEFPERAEAQDPPVDPATLSLDPAAVLEKLLRDPSLRFKEEGRQLLWLLRQNAISAQRWTELTAAVPPHCGNLVGQLAQQYAQLWGEFAREMERQAQVET